MLDPYTLAPKVGLTVMAGDDALALLTREVANYLRTEASSHWSGGVLPWPLPDGSYLCILNPAHPPRRAIALDKTKAEIPALQLGPPAVVGYDVIRGCS
ncbi:MAG: hypothetical protein ACRD19_10805 [Terriglobia bacterium]